MTLRARPVARRRGRAGWDSGDRRNNLINLGFFIAIGLSIVILLGYGAWSWYNDHFGAAATVNGQVITKDDLRARLQIESFRLNYVERRIQTLMAKAKITREDGQSQLDFIAQRREQLANLALERLVDITLMAKLANDNGIAVTEAEIDEQLRKEATTSEQRHVYQIQIEPKVDPDTGEVGDEEKREALGRAQRALARLKAGETWEDVARTASDDGLAPQAGDLSWLSLDSGYDEAFMEAVFAVGLNEPTGVIEGEDGFYRIGRYTEQAAEEVDALYDDSILEENLTLERYREAVRSDVVREKLSDKVVADLSKPSLQRHVLEIFLPEPNQSQLGAEPGVKVRHILYAPKDNADAADDLPDTDPAWAEAKAEAEATYNALRTDPTKFDELARTESDEPSARTTGGKQPWYYVSSSVDPNFKAAITADGLEPGELIPPVKSAFGWHVIEFMRGSAAGEAAWLEGLKADATDEATFKQLAIDNSEGPEAREGGDLGWIARGQLSDQLEDAVFATGIGANSNVLSVTGDGFYLLRVLGEETREPTEEQLQIFEDSGFSYWYTGQKENATIDYALGTAAEG